jgi:hypothetical protein
MLPKSSGFLKPFTPIFCSTPLTARPKKKQANRPAQNWSTASIRHGFSDNMSPVYRGGAAETMQNLKTEFSELTKFSSILIL